MSSDNGPTRRELPGEEGANVLSGDAENATQSSSVGTPVVNNHPLIGSFSLDDFVVFFTTEIIALPWGFHAQDAWTKGDYVSSLETYIFCIPIGLIGLSFHWWKAFVGASVRDWIISDSKRWWPVVLLLAFVYILGPDIYNRLIVGPAQVQPLNNQAVVDIARPKEPFISTSASPSSGVLTSEDIVAKIDIWRSINVQMNDFSTSLTQGYVLLDNWMRDIRSNRGTLDEDIRRVKLRMLTTVINLHNLRRSYPNYEDVQNILDAPIAERVVNAIDGFGDAVSILSDTLPENYENVVQPYSSALKTTLDEARIWQSATQRTALANIQELSSMGPRSDTMAK